PILIINEIDIITENVGTAILTLASATGPTPLPTKIPSITILTDINIIPNNVGKKYSKKHFTTDCVPSFSLTLAIINTHFDSRRIFLCLSLCQIAKKIASKFNVAQAVLLLLRSYYNFTLKIIIRLFYFCN